MPIAVAFALLVWGVAASVYHPSGLALISKGVDERGTGFAYHGIAGNVGIGLGPLLAAVLLLFFDWRAVAGLLRDYVGRETPLYHARRLSERVDRHLGHIHALIAEVLADRLLHVSESA